MHEKAVVQEIIDICIVAKEEYHLTNISTITMKIGPFSCVNKGQLQYLFEIAKQDTCLKETSLLFEDDAYIVECLSCHHQYQPSINTKPICNHCDSTKFKVISGYDCFVENIEGN